jgi:hypothetical protein
LGQQAALAGLTLSALKKRAGNFRLNREVELKLSARAADLPALERALAEMTPASVGIPERLITTYHDTRDLALERRGLTLRVREQGGRFIQTVRAADPAGAGMLSRREWEDAIAGRRPSPRAPMSGTHLVLVADVIFGGVCCAAGCGCLMLLLEAVGTE